MAITTDPSTYIGKVDNKVISRLFFTAKTINWGLARLSPSNKGKVAMPRINNSDAGIRADTCGVLDTIISVTDQVDANVCGYKTGGKMCIQDLSPLFNDAGLFYTPDGVWNWSQEYVDIIIKQQLDAMQGRFDQIWWMSDVDNVDLPEDLQICDGFLKRIRESNDIAIATPLATLTQATITGELARIYEAIPDVLIDNETVSKKLYIAVSPHTYKLARLAARELLLQNDSAYLNVDYMLNDGTVERVLTYMDIPLISTSGLTPDVNSLPNANDNKMIATFTDNLVVSTDALSDMMNLIVNDLTNTAGIGDVIEVKGRFKSGVNIGWGDYIVSYGLG